MRRLLLVASLGCSDPTAKPDAGIDSGPLTPGVTITPGGFQFADYELGTGAELPALAFTVRNITAADVEISTIAIGGMHAMDFPITDNACPALLAPDATCNVTVQFDPTAGDLRSAQLDVTTSSHVVSAGLSGTGIVRRTRLYFDPTHRNLGNLSVGETASATFQVLNEAVASPLVATLSGPNASSFTIAASDCATTTIPLHGSCTVTVQVTPPYAGEYKANLDLTASGGDSWGAAVSAHTATPMLLTPYTAVFDPVLIGQPEPGTERTFTLQNTTVAGAGTTTGTLTATLIGEGAADYAIASSTCTTLEPQATCSVVIRFAAATRGYKQAQLVVTDAASSIEARVALSASAYTVLISGTGTFTATASGQTTTRTFNVLNPSNRATGAITTSLVGSQFSVGTNTCASGLAANASCMIEVNFSPTATGTQTATLEVIATPGGSFSLALSGNGT